MPVLNFGEQMKKSNVMGGHKTLPANQIHLVKLKSCIEETIKGKAKEGEPEKNYDVLTLTFCEVDDNGNFVDDGRTFTDRTFPLDEKSGERRTYKNGDKVTVFPSLFETTILKFRCYMEQLCPKLYDQIESGQRPFNPQTWEEYKKIMLNIFSQIAASEKNPVCKLKLIKNKAGYADLPNFISLTKDGTNCFLSNAFIGNINITKGAKHREIAFTEYEMQKMQKEKIQKENLTKQQELLGNDLTSTESKVGEGLSADDFNDLDVSF